MHDDGRVVFACAAFDLPGQHQLQVGAGDVDGQRLPQRGFIQCGAFHRFARRPPLVVPGKSVEQRQAGVEGSPCGPGQLVADDDQFLHIDAPSPVPVLGDGGGDDGEVGGDLFAQHGAPEGGLDGLLPQVDVVFHAVLDAAFQRPAFLGGQARGQMPQQQ